MSTQDKIQQSILPIPDQQHVGLEFKYDVGKEAGSPVSPDYGPKGNEFSGEVKCVQIDLDKDYHDHLILPEERFKVAMARQ